jgi:hypothetical protein
MAVAEASSADQIQQQLDAERGQLAAAVGSLRSELALEPKLRSRLPLAAAVAFAVGFLLAGGIGATMRLLFRRGREG